MFWGDVKLIYPPFSPKSYYTSKKQKSKSYSEYSEWCCRCCFLEIISHYKMQSVFLIAIVISICNCNTHRGGHIDLNDSNQLLHRCISINYRLIVRLYLLRKVVL